MNLRLRMSLRRSLRPISLDVASAYVVDSAVWTGEGSTVWMGKDSAAWAMDGTSFWHGCEWFLVSWLVCVSIWNDLGRSERNLPINCPHTMPVLTSTTFLDRNLPTRSLKHINLPVTGTLNTEHSLITRVENTRRLAPMPARVFKFRHFVYI